MTMKKKINAHNKKAQLLQKKEEKESIWVIPPTRCKWAQQISMRVRISPSEDYNGTRSEVLCTIDRKKVNPLVFYRCCKENCPAFDEIEKIWVGITDACECCEGQKKR